MNLKLLKELCDCPGIPGSENLVSKIERRELKKFSEEIITDPRHIKQDYKNKINNFCDFFKSNCRKKNIDYIPLSTINDLNIALSEYLIKRKRIG